MQYPIKTEEGVVFVEINLTRPARFALFEDQTPNPWDGESEPGLEHYGQFGQRLAYSNL